MGMGNRIIEAQDAAAQAGYDDAQDHEGYVAFLEAWFKIAPKMPEVAQQNKVNHGQPIHKAA